MEIKVTKLSGEQLKQMKVGEWPIWEKEVSRFPWSYDSIEECFILEGDVTVETPDSESVHFSKGDFVTFPKGLSCTWDIKKPVRKHYHFR
jgi:uncharacterized cupin superfamily protein